MLATKFRFPTFFEQQKIGEYYRIAATGVTAVAGQAADYVVFAAVVCVV